MKGRPKRDTKGPSAKERIVQAFWEMIEEMPYDGIGIVALAKRANVSPNTLYYHFDNKEDVARLALQGALSREAVRSVLAGGTMGSMLDSEKGQASLHKLMLIGGSGSAELTETLAAELQSLWLEETGVPLEGLTEWDKSELSFIFSGIVRLMGSGMGPTQWRGFTTDLFERPLGRGMAETLRNLALRAKPYRGFLR